MVYEPTPQVTDETRELVCNHAGCRCEVGAGQDYCGDYCEQEPQTGMESRLHTCRCGHEPCGSVGDPATHT